MTSLRPCWDLVSYLTAAMLSRRWLPLVSGYRRYAGAGYSVDRNRRAGTDRRTGTGWIHRAQSLTSARQHVSREGHFHQDEPRYQFTRTNFTGNLEFRGCETEPKFDVYRMMDLDGKLLDQELIPKMNERVALECYRKMLILQALDEQLVTAQQEGHVSFTVSCTGEEAITIGVGAALEPEDYIFSQYREYGVLVWRDWPLENFFNQCMGNSADASHGRQMPIHYGSRELRFVSVSSPLATQMPQAVGLAYALKQSAAKKSEKKQETREQEQVNQNNGEQKQVNQNSGQQEQSNQNSRPEEIKEGIFHAKSVNQGCPEGPPPAQLPATICFFGESTTSAGDAHAAFNFAATLECAVVFVCRNNGYAISAPVEDNYRGDGIASRGPSYGMDTVRVDGNDVLAVYHATKRAREISLTKSKPVLIEAMTYRVAPHTSLVDGPLYRPEEEVRYWKEHDNPIHRLRAYITRTYGWSASDDGDLKKAIQKEVKAAFNQSRSHRLPNPELMFTDVYKELPSSLANQQTDFMTHVRRYREEYPLDKHEGAM